MKTAKYKISKFIGTIIEDLVQPMRTQQIINLKEC